MALQVVSPAVSVYRVTGKDTSGSDITEETNFKRGAILPEWVDSYQQFVLTTTGMARQVGDLPDPTLVAPEDVPQPTLLPEHGPNTVPPVPGASAVPSTGLASTGLAGTGELPKEGETKPVWEDFAAERRYMTRAKAESMKKGDLVAEVTRQHEEAVSAREHADPASGLPPAFGS